MTSFDSPITKKQYATPSQTREVIIPDETANTNSPKIVPSVGQRYGNQNFQMDNQAMSDFSSRVNPTQSFDPEQAAFEQEIREAREARRTGKERLNDGAKRRIEMLLGMTQTTKVVEIEGKTYTLRTLKDKELKEATAIAYSFDGSVQLIFEMRKQLLARSLVQLAGLDVDQFLGTNDLSARLDLIDEMDNYLLSRLHNEYNEMIDQASERYGIKTKKQAEEVADELKK